MPVRLVSSIRNNIFVGLILITPIVVTILVGNWMFQFITDVAFLFFPKAFREAHPLVFSRVFALLAVLVLLFFIGLLTRNFVGKRLYQFGDNILRRIPVLSKIYVSVRQISEALLDQSQNLFKEVVLVEYPRKGLFMLGFTTAVVPPDFVASSAALADKTLVSIFIPTAPNPTSGFVLFVPQADVIVLPITVADAMKLVVSGGAVFPSGSLPNERATLLDKLDEWMNRERVITPADQLDESSSPRPSS